MKKYLIVGTKITGYDYDIIDKLIKKYNVETYASRCYSLEVTDNLLKTLDVGYSGVKAIPNSTYAEMRGYTLVSAIKSLGRLYEEKQRVKRASTLLSQSLLALVELKGYDNFVVEDTGSGVKLYSKGYLSARNVYKYNKEDIKKSSISTYKSSAVASVLELVKYLNKPIHSVTFDYDIDYSSSLYIRKSDKKQGEYDILIQ